MKRYLVSPTGFDSRAYFLKEPEDHWEEVIRIPADWGVFQHPNIKSEFHKEPVDSSLKCCNV